MNNNNNIKEKIMKLTGPEYKINNNNITSACILLHGWGSNGDDLIQIAPEFAKNFENMVFLSPNAPDVCSANPYGRQWFEIKNDLEKTSLLDLTFSEELIMKFIDECISRFKISSSKIFLLGFSQGSTMAMHIGLHYKKKLAGVLAFSGILLFDEKFKNYKKNDTPFLIVHGKEDEVVPHQFLDYSYNKLLELNISAEKLSLDNLAHSINIQGIESAKNFISENLK